MEGDQRQARIGCAPLGPPRRARAPAIASLILALGAGIGRAEAAEVRVGSRTIGEGYVVMAPAASGEGEVRLLRRRRLVQYVNLGVYELLPPKQADQWRREPKDGQIEVVASMRVRHDFGDFRRFASSAPGASGPLLQSLDGRQVDLLYGYVQGREIGGFFDFRAGRQFETSGLDWFAFDGGWARVDTPANLSIEAFGGLAVNGNDVFGWPTWQLDGTAGTPQPGLGRDMDIARSPMLGAALASSGLRRVHARVAYRRTFTPGADTGALNRGLVEPTGEADGSAQPLTTAVDQEFVSAQLDLPLFDGVFTPFAAARYNLGTSRLDDLSAGLDLAVSDRHRVRAQYLRTIPSFDLDSIFNLFALQPLEDVRLSYQVRAGGGWTLQGRGRVRVFRSELAEDEAAARTRALALGWGASLSALWRRHRFAARVDGFAQGGEGGTVAGGSLDGQVRVAHDRVGLDLRTYASGYGDETRQGWAVAVQAGADAQVWRGVHVTLLAEEMVTPYLRHAFRGLAMLGFDWSMRGGGR
ncbi:hypothetical protein PPSIR1_11070 [Plesiocystis pacifica SIR-1]|uniref:Uncharacterized protein n=1 Tax=Plesiocystis pacifica SIR-1 TaxID=391625 RepID=A6GH73_9BACT|nr:hypothetical protein [Plesiocystis pacifica]EDM74795.1 hypothetical protein PPSIR1_11070 [Plesiocystis pacifica SIR-1]